MKSVQPERNTDLERGFEPLRTAFAVLTLLFGFMACARAESVAAFLEARARDGHPASCIAHDGSEVSRLALRTPDHAEDVAQRQTGSAGHDLAGLVFVIWCAVFGSDADGF